MLINHSMKRRFPIGRLLVILGLQLLCGMLLGCTKKASPPAVYPSTDAPVTAEIDGSTLLITNNSDQAIYHRILPTEILPVIEWAPCLAPETCPAAQTVLPGEQQRIAINSVARDGSESISVFWWIYLQKLPGASIPPLEMNDFELPFP
jgi:hypothetical protein